MKIIEIKLKCTNCGEKPTKPFDDQLLFICMKCKKIYEVKLTEMKLNAT